MADTKISALPASTTPLAGTEVLPIVQSGATKQVSVADLTTGRALSATQLTLTTGNLIVSSGKGIDFSATPGTGTSELLADYEEGTWTPSVGVNGFNGTPAVSSTVGRYTKVGRMVTVTMELNFAANTYPGYSVITGLPFAPTTNGVGVSTGANPGSGAQGGTLQTNSGSQVVWWASFNTNASSQWNATVTYFA